MYININAMIYARNAYSCDWGGNAVALIYLPAGAIYTDESRVDIDGNTSFGYNSAKGKPRRKRGLEYPRYLIWCIANEGS